MIWYNIYYVIKFMPEPYPLQEETTCDGKIITACELVVKYQYMNCMQDNINWYLVQSPQHNYIIVPTHTIVHPCLDLTTVTKVKNTKCVCNKSDTQGYTKASVFPGLFSLGYAIFVPCKVLF